MLIERDNEHGVVYRKTDTMYRYQGWPSVARTGEGELIASFSGYRMAHICPFGKTVLCRSSDNGRTWSPPIIVNDGPLDDRDAGITALGGGRLLVTWFRHPAEVMERQYNNYIKNALQPDAALTALAQVASYKYLSDEERLGGSFLRISEDNGVTWSDAVRVPVSAPHGPSVMSDGSLLYLGKELYSYGALTPDCVAAYASKDGYSWEKRAEIIIPDGYAPVNFHEPHVIELPGGRLLGAIRAQSLPTSPAFTFFTCYSDDHGYNWSVPRPTGISGSPPQLLLHSSGCVICSFGRREAPFGERAVVSYDGGESWRDEYVIDGRANEGDLGYPCTVELADGSLYTVYYQRYPGDDRTSILYTRWTL